MINIANINRETKEEIKKNNVFVFFLLSVCVSICCFIFISLFSLLKAFIVGKFELFSRILKPFLLLLLLFYSFLYLYILIYFRLGYKICLGARTYDVCVHVCLTAANICFTIKTSLYILCFA